MVESLLPALIGMVRSESGDIRFLCLKIFTDILVRYLNDPIMYNAFEGTQESTYGINQLIIKKLLPLYRNILEDQVISLQPIRSNIILGSYPTLWIETFE